MKTSGNWGRNRRNQGGTIVETWVEPNWKLEQKSGNSSEDKWKLEWKLKWTKVEHVLN